MPLSKNELILGQFSDLSKWPSVYRHPVSLVCISIVFTHTSQETQDEAAVGRRGLVSSVARKL